MKKLTKYDVPEIEVRVYPTESGYAGSNGSSESLDDLTPGQMNEDY